MFVTDKILQAALKALDSGTATERFRAMEALATPKAVVGQSFLVYWCKAKARPVVIANDHGARMCTECAFLLNEVFEHHYMFTTWNQFADPTP